jgi:hypothetical protein
MDDQLVWLIDQADNEFAAPLDILKSLPDDAAIELREIRAINMTRPLAAKTSDGTSNELRPQDTDYGFDFWKFRHSKFRKRTQLSAGMSWLSLKSFSRSTNFSQ